MMALQKSLLDQSDIVPVLKSFKFRLSDSGLMVMNPPIIKFEDEKKGEIIKSTSVKIKKELK